MSDSFAISMPAPTTAVATLATRRHATITTRRIGALAIGLLSLLSVYDKTGIAVTIGAREISVALYKVLFLVIVICASAGALSKPTRLAGRLDRRLLRVLIAFVIVQTGASLAGLYAAPGDVALSSEVYYLIQRSQVLVVPLLALRYKLSPRALLKLLVAAAAVHVLFIGFQFASPGLYRSFVDHLSDESRIDVTREWDGKVLAYIGLMRTGNYGAFAAALGLLSLAFVPRRRITRWLRAGLVGVSLVIAATGGSRSVLIMAAVAMSVFVIRRRLFLRKRVLVHAAVMALLAFCALLIVQPELKSFRSVYAFVDEEREASNMGKVTIAGWGLQLFSQSPYVGWGQRRFADISRPLGNSQISSSETHSYMLSTLLGTGLVGSLMYVVLVVAILKRLWRRRDREYVIVTGMFLGLTVYNITYDAGALDVFALFNGIVAYYALTVSTSGSITTRKPVVSMTVHQNSPAPA